MTDNSSIDLSLTNIWRAWRAFRSGKKSTHDILEFESNLESNLIQLCYELNKGLYTHGGYHHRIINEKKRRDISVATVRDRIIHRMLYDYLTTVFDASFDPDVWSCRIGKGLHGALNRTAELCSKYPATYIWRADVTKFFDNVNQNTLRSCITRKVTDEKAVNVLDKVIRSYSCYNIKASKQGMPIGNLTSQIFANIYLNELDRFVRHRLKPLAYIRYGDDFMLFLRKQNTSIEISRGNN